MVPWTERGGFSRVLCQGLPTSSVVGVCACEVLWVIMWVGGASIPSMSAVSGCLGCLDARYGCKHNDTFRRRKCGEVCYNVSWPAGVIDVVLGDPLFLGPRGRASGRSIGQDLGILLAGHLPGPLYRTGLATATATVVE